MRSVLNRFNPYLLSAKTIKILTIAFFAITLPIYIFIGLQPAGAVAPNFHIPSIGLHSTVEQLELQNGKLNTPPLSIGAFSMAENKTLLIGHSSTVFANLHSVNLGDIIEYQDDFYQITDIYTTEKSKISMSKLLAASDQPTIVLMTCAGRPLGNQDYTHRLIVTAIKQ